MEFGFFVYTVLVAAICASAIVTSLASLIITRNHMFALMALMFLCYVSELLLIFQNEYMNHGQLIPLDAYYVIEQPFLKMALAAGVLECGWLIVCDYMEEKRLWLQVAPVLVFCLCDTLITLLMPQGNVPQMLFYSMREVFIFFMMGYCVLRYLKEEDPVRRTRMARAKTFFMVIVVLTCCIVVENTFFILLWDPTYNDTPLILLYLSERNFSENMLIIACAAVAIRTCVLVFSRYSRGPDEAAAPQAQRQMETILPRYCTMHNLTARECEVVRLMIEGKDNQNIASELQLALGTVKSHTHNILKKTGQANRAELIKDFWSTV